MKYNYTNNTGHGGHYDPEPLKQEVKGCIFSSAVIFVVLGALLALACITGCTKYVTKEVPVILHDTTTCVQMRIDSITTRDSVWREIYTKGDTTFLHDVEIRYRDRVKILHDTANKVKYIPKEIIVEIEKPVEVIKEVEKPLKRWQKYAIAAGLTAAITVLLKLLYYIYTHTRAKGVISRIIKIIQRQT